ncbi:elongation factor-like GTPase 1 [Ornithodoros turicata]|uniref:elongation factor-like GTPase 1 n=1 Tax=Ornithodoros turicata TaxID=34597 RepID=UPI0031397F93
MRKVSVQHIQELQKRAEQIRNVCILAHVDHGKTTLADSLIASNGIISQRMSGKLRYMDNRKDEQERGITMKSSAIALYYDRRDLLVNLVDSPGHVDFTSEVISAVRLCDGAVLVVDVVEGVCAQTKVSLQLAWSEHLKPLLVLNKIDRLILEKKMTPLDAYVRLSQVLEQVNAVVAELFTTQVLEKSSKPEDVLSSHEEQVFDWSSGLQDADDSTVYFSPEQGNVVFASAYDGWGFSVEQFAELYAEKMGVRKEILQKTLWGDFYINTKTKRIQKGAQAKAKKPLFAQLVLENIWDVYDAVCTRRDQVKTERIASSLGLKESRHGDPRSRLQNLVSQWMPLAKAVLEMTWGQAPSPKQLDDSRAEALLCPASRRFDDLPAASRKLKDAFLACSSSMEAPTVVCISKMVAVDAKQLPENKPRFLTPEEMAERREEARRRHAERMAQANDTSVGLPETVGTPIEDQKTEVEEQEDTVFVAFARVFSGTLRRGQKVFVLGPKHDPAKFLEKGREVNPELTLADLPPDEHVTVATVEKLYLLMGRDLEALDEVPAGSILGIGGLEKHVGRTATLSTDVACPPFVDVCGSNMLGAAILRVALEPKAGVQDIGVLRRGLKLLQQADACAQVLVQETGEHVLVTAGEVHLERCLHDLVNRFAKIEIDVSDPIVPFRETVVEPPRVDMVNEAIEDKQPQKQANKGSGDEEDVGPDGVVTVCTADRKVTLRVRAAPLPSEVTQMLEEQSALLKDYSLALGGQIPEALLHRIADLKSALEKAFKEAGWEDNTLDQFWSLGPRRCGPNVLLNRVPGYARPSLWPASSNVSQSEAGNSQSSCSPDKDDTKGLKLLDELDHCVVNGFQLTTLSGPLCQEPMMGVAFVIEGWEVSSDSTTTGAAQGPLSGQLISAMKDGCRRAFQAQPQRLMCAMYTCAIQVNTDALRQVYAVLGRRHGRVLGGDMHEGSSTFEVTAVLPVVESFQFANEMRKQTSGLANPQLVFSHWETVDVDPFWVPSTEEEYLHFGEKADTENRARKYVDAVRRRKGLPVAQNIVERAEKQRTLHRKK